MSIKIKNNNYGGFTLVELTVTLSIALLLMSIVLFDYRNFNDNLALSSAGQEIAISIRQAQTYGIDVREVSAGGGVFSAAYGVYFDKNLSPSDYYVFADKNGNKLYDPGVGNCGSATTECIEKVTLRNGVTVSSICNVQASVTTCPPNVSTVSMHVTFLRPNPDAVIYFANSSGTVTFSNQLTGKVRLISRAGKTLDITVENTGQILAQ